MLRCTHTNTPPFDIRPLGLLGGRVNEAGNDTLSPPLGCYQLLLQQSPLPGGVAGTGWGGVEVLPLVLEVLAATKRLPPRTVFRTSPVPCSSTARRTPAVASSPMRRLSTLSTTSLGPVGNRPQPLQPSVPAIYPQNCPGPSPSDNLPPNTRQYRTRKPAQVQGLNPGCANSAKSLSSLGPQFPHLNNKGLSGL